MTSSSSSSSDFSSGFDIEKLTEYYDVIKEGGYMGKRFTKQELIKMRDEGLEIDLESEEEFKAENAQEEMEKDDFYANLMSSPFPQTEGKFANCVSFKDRCRLMDEISKGRLYKHVLRPGNGKPVEPDDAVLFHLNAFFAESYDEPFDSTFARKKPILSKLNRVLKGYALALLKMKVGEFAEYAIHRSMAYGELGCPPRIPPNSDIIVIIEVLDVYTKGSIQYYHSLSNYELEEDDILTHQKLVEFANDDRTTGSTFYREGNYRKALFHYRRAIDMLERNSLDNAAVDEVNSILLTLYHNAANCQIQLSHGPSVINFARRALRIDPESVKANYQLAKGYMNLGKLERARMFLLKARRSRPFDPDINRELEVLNHKLTVANMESKTLYKAMGKSLFDEKAKKGKGGPEGQENKKEQQEQEEPQQEQQEQEQKSSMILDQLNE